MIAQVAPSSQSELAAEPPAYARFLTETYGLPPWACRLWVGCWLDSLAEDTSGWGEQLHRMLDDIEAEEDRLDPHDEVQVEPDRSAQHDLEADLAWLRAQRAEAAGFPWLQAWLDRLMQAIRALHAPDATSALASEPEVPLAGLVVVHLDARAPPTAELIGTDAFLDAAFDCLQVGRRDCYALGIGGCREKVRRAYRLLASTVPLGWRQSLLKAARDTALAELVWRSRHPFADVEDAA